MKSTYSTQNEREEIKTDKKIIKILNGINMRLEYPENKKLDFMRDSFDKTDQHKYKKSNSLAKFIPICNSSKENHPQIKSHSPYSLINMPNKYLNHLKYKNKQIQELLQKTNFCQLDK